MMAFRPHVEFEIFEPESDREVAGGTVARARATCVCCRRCVAAGSGADPSSPPSAVVPTRCLTSAVTAHWRGAYDCRW